MKKILGLLLLLVSFASYGQFTNYTNINGRYKWIAGKFDSTFTLPSGTTPSLRTGGGTGPGALFYSTTDSSVYQYTGSQWSRLRGTDTAHVISAYVRNTTGSILTPGQVVYINGSTGTTPTIALANNKQDSTSAMTFGFVRGNIAINGFGWITAFGPLEGVNTNAYTEGEVIYLDSIPGQFTHDKPQAPYHMVTLGYIVKKSGGNGTIFAKIQNGYELEELHNVRITAPVLNKSVIIYDSVRRLWVDTTVSAAGLGLGGSGTTNYLPKWTSSSALGNSIIDESSNTVTITGSGGNAYLNIKSPSGSYYPALTFYSNGISTTSISSYLTRLYFGGAGGIYFNNTQMLLTSSGRLLIGTTTESTYELDVVGDIRSTLDANINGLTVGKGGGSVATNTAVGINALSVNTSGSGNTSVGWGSALAVNTGSRNTYLGQSSAYQASSGSDNVAVGWSAANTLTTGTGNIFIGSPGSVGSNGITTGNYNTIIGTNVTGLSASLSNTIILADGQGNQRIRVDNSGNVGVNTLSPYSLANYTSLSINNSVAGSATGSVLALMRSDVIQFRLLVSGTAIGISGLTSLPMIFETNGSERARIFATTGNVAIGTTTDAGYKLQVSGTTQTTALRISNGSVICDNSYIANAFVLGGSTSLFFYNNSAPQIRANSTDITVYTLVPQLNTQSTLVINDAGSAPSGYKIQKWMTGSVEKAYLEKDGNLAVLTSGLFGSIGSVNASAILEATSTTKGFLPPRMTGTQAEAIATPAEGLMVYSTDGSGTTITSKGWWGYDGTTWVKLN